MSKNRNLFKKTFLFQQHKDNGCLNFKALAQWFSIKLSLQKVQSIFTFWLQVVSSTIFANKGDKIQFVFSYDVDEFKYNAMSYDNMTLITNFDDPENATHVDILNNFWRPQDFWFYIPHKVYRTVCFIQVILHHKKLSPSISHSPHCPVCLVVLVKNIYHCRC